MGDSGEQEHQAALARLTALVAGREERGAPQVGPADHGDEGATRGAGENPGLPPWWQASTDTGQHSDRADTAPGDTYNGGGAHGDGTDEPGPGTGSDARTGGAADDAGARTDGRPGLRIPLPARWRGARGRMGRHGMIVALVVAALAAAWAGVGTLRDTPVTQAVPPVAGGTDGPVPETLPTDQATHSTAGDAGAAADPGGADEDTGGEIVVAVQGLVGSGGLVRLPAGARVDDAIAAAGGPLEGADLLSLNLAQPLADGDQVLVGVAPTDGEPPRLGSATVTAADAGTAADADSGPGGDTGGDGPLDLNSATATQLATLPGIGPVTAEAIVASRTEQGPFTTVDELTRVSGIGPARLANLRSHVTVR